MTIFEYAEQNGWKESFLMDKVLDKVIEYGKEVSEEEFEAYVNEALGYDVLEEETATEETDAEADSEEEAEDAEEEDGEGN